jgi:hypothetical protein
MKTYEIIARIVVGVALVVMAAVHAAGILAALASAIVATGQSESQPTQTETVEPPVLMALPDARLSVVELRTLARHRLGSSARLAGRRIAQSTRADLLAALGAA